MDQLRAQLTDLPHGLLERGREKRNQKRRREEKKTERKGESRLRPSRKDLCSQSTEKNSSAKRKEKLRYSSVGLQKVWTNTLDSRKRERKKEGEMSSSSTACSEVLERVWMEVYGHRGRRRKRAQAEVSPEMSADGEARKRQGMRKEEERKKEGKVCREIFPADLFV